VASEVRVGEVRLIWLSLFTVRVSFDVASVVIGSCSAHHFVCQEYSLCLPLAPSPLPRRYYFDKAGCVENLGPGCFFGAIGHLRLVWLSIMKARLFLRAQIL